MGDHQPELFMPADAEKFFAGQVGKPYQPLNGAEGEMFMSQWCALCKHDAAFRADPDRHDGCAIVGDTMALDIDDPDYPHEWQWSAKGQPICTAFERKDADHG